MGDSSGGARRSAARFQGYAAAAHHRLTDRGTPQREDLAAALPWRMRRCASENPTARFLGHNLERSAARSYWQIVKKPVTQGSSFEAVPSCLEIGGS